jgi:hypothetical protein
MQGTLVLTILSVQSSYRENVERPLVSGFDIPDTIQWWIAPNASWRIRTFGIDHDIHTYSLGNAEDGDADGLVDLALSNAEKHYGDVIQSQHVIHLADSSDANEIESAFREAGLRSRIEIAPGRFAFWKPDDAPYETKSGH